ncbi:putative thiamine transport system ATP-binding protein [Tistlia consotensis]|uniref:Putative thiamine transport system ATP-binding protein n=1 Tax=Tistlia consotensis USBA 355 TaxID=560819 RepID=A0A1Y6BLE1_9PROT|nr:ATP-binding cassette domain-containing protein [Tistlia consotensis]SMF06998.1 putative thiamine transport system ATP-binding protein [Tistlia consotensis USBA 355]SNR36144.1 putative thiamine transport system ATP-binding protein [Tistlia consotensis]
MSGLAPADPGPDRALVLEGIGLRLGGRSLVEGLDLTVPPGEVVTLMGPSGVGKSSLLDFVCGTLDPAFEASGRVRLAGRELTGLPPERRAVGILFQDDLLFPHLSVAENLAFGIPPSVRGRRRRRARVAEALAEAGLAGFESRDPATLSGGQRARVALFRTLLAEPRALLLDEPFGKLDVALRDRVRRFVFDHARARALPTLLVTHDPADARAAGGPRVELSTPGMQQFG